MNDKHLPDASAENPWLPLRQLTPARIALGRTGTSLPTRPQLDFQYAHAQARDAVHLPFDHAAISDGLRQRGRDSLLLHSAAADRHVYLQRPDLGRRLDEASVQRLREHAAGYDGQIDLAIVVADGLSALAVQRHTLPFLERLEEQALAEGWSLSPVVLVEQGRVAVADEIGELLRAKMSVILIGERPGLSSPDSLGLYFTWAPRVGLTDAYRNCISNVRLEGLSYGMAAHRLLYLMREACRRQLSGVNLKDEAEVQALDGEAPRTGNFLLARDRASRPKDGPARVAPPSADSNVRLDCAFQGDWAASKRCWHAACIVPAAPSRNARPVMRIVQATLEHLDLLAPLFVKYREFYGMLSYPESSRKFLEKRLRRKESVIYLALADEEDRLLGFCQLYPSFSSLSLKRVWILNDIYVAEEARRQLVADHLLQHAKQMARETHAVRMRVSTSVDNEVAQKVYESIGFREDQEFKNYTLPISDELS